MRHVLTAFGLAVDADWPMAGSRPLPAPAGRPGTSVRLLPPQQIEAEWSRPAERVFQPGYPDARARITVDRTGDHYRLWFDGFGRYLVSGDGTAVGCEAGALPRERQERLVFAQCLPLAAALQGLEPLHASAVVAGDGGVAAFVGPSGAGKTTIAGGLVLRGAELVSDDVLALECGPDALLAHPGARMMVVHGEDGPAAERAGRLGPTVGRSDKIHVSVATVARALPLRVVYHLERGDALRIVPLEEGGVRRVLSSVFSPYLATPERLRRHLDTARLLSVTAAHYRVQAPRGARPDDVVDAVATHLGERTCRC